MPRYLLARTGPTGGSRAGLQPTMLADVVATFGEGYRAPIAFDYHPGDFGALPEDDGRVMHPTAGHVVRVWTEADGKELWGQIEWIPAVEEAIEEGWFQDRSVGIAFNADGRAYLHHVALLGGLPPAIKGMESLRALAALPEAAFSDDLAAIRLFSEPVHEGTGTVPDTRTLKFYDTLLIQFLREEIRQLAESEDSGYADAEAVFGAMVEAGPDGLTREVLDLIFDGDIPEPRTEWLDAIAGVLGVSPRSLEMLRWYYGDYSDLGDIIRAAREDAELSLEQMAEAMAGDGSRDASTLGQIERGEILDVPTEVLQSLAAADALDLSIATLEKARDRGLEMSDTRRRPRRSSHTTPPTDDVPMSKQTPQFTDEQATRLLAMVDQHRTIRLDALRQAAAKRFPSSLVDGLVKYAEVVSQQLGAAAVLTFSDDEGAAGVDVIDQLKALVEQVALMDLAGSSAFTFSDPAAKEAGDPSGDGATVDANKMAQQM